MNKILIMEFHHGTSLSHQKIFEKLGYTVEVFTTFYVSSTKIKKFFYTILFYLGSASSFKFNQLFFTIINLITSKKINYYHFLICFGIESHQEILSNIDKSRLEIILDDQYLQKYFNQFDYLMCSFPPSMFQFLKIIADKFDKKIILNIGHRFNIWIHTKQENTKLKQDLINLHQDEKHILAVASEYDYQYVKHYLRIDAEKLYLETLQIELSKKSPPPQTKNIILY